MFKLFKKSTGDTAPKKENSTPMDKKQKISTIVGIVLCVLLIPVLVINCTLIIKSLVSDDVPSIGGKIPLIVLTESMEPDINAGDLIICHVLDKDEIKALKKGDVISFFDPAGNGTSIVTHEIYEDPYVKDGKLYFTTKGTNNNTEDKMPVCEDDIVGLFKGGRIGGVGHIAMFMQSTAGLIICIFVPLAALVGYELYRAKKKDKVKENDIEALMAELQALKNQQAGAEKKTDTESEAEPEEDKKD